MKKTWNNVLGGLLMDAATDAGGAGGGASNSFITPGGGAVPPASGTPNPAPGAAANPPANDPAAGGAPAGAAAPSWLSSLPKELQDDVNIKKFPDVSTLAKSFVNAQKLIGADKIVVPNKYTTPEEWTAIHRKLGVPEKIEEYGVKFKDGVTVDEKFSNEFKTLAHKNGILPGQAQALADWFSDVNKGAEQELAKTMDTQFKQNLADLQKDWGNAFQINIARANKVVNEVGGEEFAKYLNDTGMGADKRVIQFFAKLGEQMYGEDTFVDGASGAQIMDPKAVQSAIDAIKANPAYFDKNHPQQKALVQEMATLMGQLHPAKK